MPGLADLSSLVWLLVFLIALRLFQRGLHREFQLIVLLLTRRPEASLVVFSLVFLPGVLLHELSHYLTALLTGVRTGKLSIFPRTLPGGKLRLGYVETAQVDILRETLIGIAPLVTGVAFVAYVGIVRLQLETLGRGFDPGNLSGTISSLEQIYRRPDFWLWFYLLVTVSSMMMPSASDRRAWLPMGIVVGSMLLLGFLVGAGPWLSEHLAPGLGRFFRTVAAVLAISFMVHAVLYVPLRLVRGLLTWITGAAAS